METLPESTLADDVRTLGYKVEADGLGECLVPHAICAAVITEGSTRATYRTTHPGIIAISRFRFSLP